MSPTVLREKGYRFFFFSKEEPRCHIHVEARGGEAKFWLEPSFNWLGTTAFRASS
jgi:hypothetical protein